MSVYGELQLQKKQLRFSSFAASSTSSVAVGGTEGAAEPVLETAVMSWGFSFDDDDELEGFRYAEWACWVMHFVLPQG